MMATSISTSDVQRYFNKPWRPWIGSPTESGGYPLSYHKKRIRELGKKFREQGWLPSAEINVLWAEYRKTKQWQARRSKVFQRAKGICEKCNNNVCEDCHHIHYANRFNEPIDDLLGVCRSCHEWYTSCQNNNKNNRALKVA